nr:helix-turn-helix transcriptional regulator [Ornithinimicrobium sp. F0845]
MVSVRSLQLAFRRELDTTPMAHLRRVRLDRVHAELVRGDSQAGATVTAIATRWGFPNNSRFAAQYRQAFGMLPSQTLHGA